MTFNASVYDRLLDEVKAELVGASIKHPAQNSLHEGYAVLIEEVEEFWAEVKAQRPNPQRVREELIQVAAMALRTIHDVLGDGQ